MIWGTIRRSVASSWTAGSRINPASIRQTCFTPAEAMTTANGFERIQTFSYSLLGGRVAATAPSMGSDGTFSNFLAKPGCGIEINGSVSQSNTEKGSAVPVTPNMNAMNFIEMEKVVNSLAQKGIGSVSVDKMAGGTFPKFSSGVYGSLFSSQIFNSHKLAILGMHSDNTGLSLGKNGLAVRHYSTDKPNTPNSLRPLSPHLPVYKPQSNALFSIFNRISAAFLSVEILLVYLLLQIGSTSFTYYNFYQLFFYSSKLTLLATELTALALAYHLVYGIGALVRPYRR